MYSKNGVSVFKNCNVIQTFFQLYFIIRGSIKDKFYFYFCIKIVQNCSILLQSIKVIISISFKNRLPILCNETR